MRFFRIALLLISMMLVSELNAKEKYAVIIGINHYKDPHVRPLQYSEADALYLRDVMLKYARYKAENIYVLLGKEATYLNIKDKIYWLGDVANKEDDVLFYFSGHGTRVPDDDHEEADGMDEAFCPYETDVDKPASLILDDDIGHWFRRVRAKHILVVLDCCHSGGAAGRSLENDGSRGLTMAGQSQARSMIDTPDDPYARDLSLDNKFIMAASTADELSYENPELGHGVFTYYFGEAIRGNADMNKDNKVTYKELFDYTQEKTHAYAKSQKEEQTPTAFGYLSDAVVSVVNQQLCELRGYAPDLNVVILDAGKGVVKPGDQMIIRKNVSSFARDIEIADMKVFKVQIQKVDSNYAQANIIERYFNNVNIPPDSYKDYYGERLKTGSINIRTTPWSTVFLDGKEIGPTPVSIPGVISGDHQLEFHIAEIGYPEVVEKTVTVEGDQQLRLSETFKKIQ